jgi:hypothetical protein
MRHNLERMPMSLWTPGGEHPVGREGPDEGAHGTPDPELQGVQPERLSAEEQAQLEAMRAQMEEVQAQLLAAPAALVVVNHAMGIYELAALHLMQPEPKLAEASLAIDALAALVEGLPGRLGEDERTVREALAQLRAAYLEVRARQEGDKGNTET